MKDVPLQLPPVWLIFVSVLIILNWQLLTVELFAPKHICLSKGAPNAAAWLINSLVISHSDSQPVIPQVAAKDKIVWNLFLSPSWCFFHPFFSLSFPTPHLLAPLLFVPLFGTSAITCSAHAKHRGLKIHESSWSQTSAYVYVPLNLSLWVVKKSLDFFL